MLIIFKQKSQFLPKMVENDWIFDIFDQIQTIFDIN